MPKEAVFTMKLEPELRDQFMAEAVSQDRPASQIMRDYLENRRQEREYEDHLRRKVEAGRASMRAGKGRPDNEVERTFAGRREQARTAGS